MKNPFERKPNKVEEFEADPEVLELLIEETRRALAASDKTVSESDIRDGAFRAMRAADKAGTPYTKENVMPGDADLDAKLLKATEIQVGIEPGGYRLADADSTIIRQAGSQAEIERLAREQRESHER